MEILLAVIISVLIILCTLVYILWKRDADRFWNGKLAESEIILLKSRVSIIEKKFWKLYSKKIHNEQNSKRVK